MTDDTTGAPPDPWAQHSTLTERPKALGPGVVLPTDVWGRPITPELSLWAHVAGSGRADDPWVITVHVGDVGTWDGAATRWPTLEEIREALSRFALRGTLFLPGGPIFLADDRVALPPEPLTFVQGGAIGPSPAQTRLQLSAGARGNHGRG